MAMARSSSGLASLLSLSLFTNSLLTHCTVIILIAAEIVVALVNIAVDLWVGVD